ncbi:hypothetical protein [Robertkochia flava]|uniref:hypothetical protein n=1 Tax=Robertkochia flava TaxID=3447986 RepID=UPI001CCF8D4F|nr:hypothetical protein [Robertkochia marina]
MKTLITVLGLSLLLCSCQGDSDLQETEALTSADARYIAEEDTTPAQTETSEESGDQEGEEVSCETLFARGTDEESRCFSQDGFSRWGWTLGPLSEGEYTFELYAGAGQCDIEKGTLVGHLTLNYSDGSASVTYEMLEGFTLSETHLYIGSVPYPEDNKGEPTVAPGEYPDQHELDNASGDSFQIDGLSGEIYVIAHGVSCSGEGNGSGDGNTTDGEEETNPVESDPNYTPS